MGANTIVAADSIASGQSGRRSRKLENTINHIGATAWALFEAHGFDAVSMESIALAADVAKGTLYKHFPVKESLIGHRFDGDRRAHAEQINAAVMAKITCADRLALRLQFEAQYIERMRRYMAPYVRYKLAGEPSMTAGGIERFVVELLTAGQVSGEITPTISASHLAEYLRMLRLAVLVRWLQTPDSSLSEMNTEMLRLFFLGAQASQHTTP